MSKLAKVSRKRIKRKRKNTRRNIVRAVAILIVVIIGIGKLTKNKINYNDSDKEVGKNQDKSVNYNIDISEDDEENLDLVENVTTTTNKKGLVYDSYENDIYADNAKDIENMLNKWNYLQEDGKKITYLTFDDGPSTEVTEQILQILKVNNVKATFFVLGSNVEKSDKQKELLKEMVSEGHAIGNHGYCHDYRILYPGRIADVTAFMNDIKKSEDVMKSVLGDDFSTKVIRLPGGHMSWDTKSLDPVLEQEGYSYIDWNTLNGDAESNGRTTEQLISRLKGSIGNLSGNDDVLVILMHDTNAKETTAQSLQETINYLKSLGYEFRTLK